MFSSAEANSGQTLDYVCPNDKKKKKKKAGPLASTPQAVQGSAVISQSVTVNLQPPQPCPAPPLRNLDEI